MVYSLQMKNTILCALVSLLVSATSFASEQGTASWLKSKLAGKSLVCQPADHHKVSDSRYRGDEGYFTISVVGKKIVVSNGGGRGYGFSNEGVISATHASSTLYLNVGDDGSQTLNFDLFNIGADSQYPDNCGLGILISQPDINLYSSDNVECCLK